VPAVTELVVAQLMYLEWMNSKEPVYIYINSTGTARDDGEPVSKIVKLVTCSQVSLLLWLTTCTLQLIHVNGMKYEVSMSIYSFL